MCARAGQSKVHLEPQSASIERRMGGHLSVSSRLPTGTASVSSFRLGLRPGFFGGPTNPHQRLHAAFWRWKCSLRRSPVNHTGIFCRREVLVGSGQFGLPLLVDGSHDDDTQSDERTVAGSSRSYVK